MGYFKAIISVLILVLVIVRNHFPGQLFALLHRLFTFIKRHLHLLALVDPRPRLLAFINNHPRLYALFHRNPGLLSPIHTPPPRPSPLDSSPFRLLAPETIHHIASLLPPSSAASFASTCLPIRLMTGTQYLSPLRACPYELISFLSFLALDLNTPPTTTSPSHLLCLYCRRLVPYPSLCGPTATPSCKESSTSFQHYAPSSFRHQIFHTAMLIYRHGHNPYPLISNMIPPSATVGHDNGVAAQVSWKYRVIQGSLYQRARWTFILPRCDMDYTLAVQPCAHYATYQKAMDREAMNMQDEARDRSGMRACSEMVSCQKCRTVLRVGCRKFRGLGLGLFVTWWVDLGDACWVVRRREGEGWKDVKYSRKWLTDYFDSLCHSQRYFDFEGMDTRADRKELLAIARSSGI